MNFFLNIRDKIKEKTEIMLEKKEFLTMVEDESKPIRRKAYLEQKKRDAWKEGQAIAQNETQKNLQKNLPQKRTESDFGIKGLEDPYKYLRPSKKSKSKEKKK